MTDDVHATLWRALEGALGPEKTAILREAPLDELVRNKVAEDTGMNFQGTFTLPDAIVSIAARRRQKQAEYQRVRDGINALRALYPERSKAASAERSNPLIERETLWHMVGAVKRAHISAQHVNEKTAAEIGVHREDVEDRIFNLLHKEANAMRAAFEAAKNSNLAKGLAWGTGAAVPAVIAGRYLTEKGVEDAQSAALQTGGTLAAGGLAAAGLYRTLKNSPRAEARRARPEIPGMQRPAQQSYGQPGQAPQALLAQMLLNKRASTVTPAQKLAATLDLDARLDTLDMSHDKKAALRRRARRDGVLALTEGLRE